MVEKDVGFVGDVMNINSGLLKTVVKDGYIPVVATVACDDKSQTLNINADLAAGEVGITENSSRISVKLCSHPNAVTS